MSYPIFYPIEGTVLPILFATYAGATGASLTLTGLAVTDVEIYKGTSMTQRASDAGYTLLDTDGIDIDSTTGIHGFSVDLNDNTDAGFYAVGSWYYVVVSSITVDAQTVNFIAAAFRIVSTTRGLAGTALPAAAADAAGGLPISDAGGLALDDLSTFDASTDGVTLATDGLDAAALATDAVTEINAGNPTNFSALAITAAGKVTVGTNDDKTSYRLSGAGVDDIHDDVVEGTLTHRQMMRIFLSVLAGIAADMDTDAPRFRDLANSKDRVAVTGGDENGNRPEVVLDGT